MIALVSQLKKFVVKAYNKVKQALPAYSHKNSPKKYTQHQHAILLMLKKKFKATYRDVIDYISEMPDIRAVIGLKAIQHYTTIQKFFHRIDEHLLLSLIAAYTCRTIAVDSTGFAAYSSRYYDKIANKSRKKRFQKMVIAIDTDKQLVLNCIPAIGYTYDSRYFIPLMKELKAKYVVADKGYDSTVNMLYAIRKGMKPLIDIRKGVKTGIRARLKKKNKRYKKIYHQRSKVESVIFVIKRKFGDTVYSRDYSLLRKEIILNVVCYNTYREILLAIIEVFYKDKSLTVYLFFSDYMKPRNIGEIDSYLEKISDKVRTEETGPQGINLKVYWGHIKDALKTPHCATAIKLGEIKRAAQAAFDRAWAEYDMSLFSDIVSLTTEGLNLIPQICENNRRFAAKYGYAALYR